MDGMPFDDHLRLPSQSRRALLAAALAVATGLLVTPGIGRAGNAGKQAKIRCKRQRSACAAKVNAHCLDNETCLNVLLPCCAPLGKCNAGEATQCFLSG